MLYAGARFNGGGKDDFISVGCISHASSGTMFR